VALFRGFLDLQIRRRSREMRGQLRAWRPNGSVFLEQVSGLIGAVSALSQRISAIGMSINLETGPNDQQGFEPVSGNSSSNFCPPATHIPGRLNFPRVRNYRANSVVLRDHNSLRA